jgi:Fe-S oxidoreductase
VFAYERAGPIPDANPAARSTEGNPVSTTATRQAPFDRQGDQTDEQRLDAAMRSFADDFSRVAALHMESCVACGLCAQACHFHLATRDPRYTPAYKLLPFRRAYQREAGPFAPLVRALGLVKKPTVEELRQWGSPATPGEDLPDILAEVSAQHGVEIPCNLEQADILVTAAPAELGEHTKALADAARILHRIGARWTMHQAGFDASNIGFNNGDVELQERLTRSIIDTALRIGAHTVLLPECGHAYGAARWEAARWYEQALPVRVIHMTEFLDELLQQGRIRVHPVGGTATFHDPCQIVRRGGLEDAARRVLAALGFELHELQDHGLTGLCCGGGGGVVSNQRAAGLRHAVFELKRQQVEATGAERFVTSCGQCRITLEMGARQAKWDRRPDSLLELVADHLAE